MVVCGAGLVPLPLRRASISLIRASRASSSEACDWTLCFLLEETILSARVLMVKSDEEKVVSTVEKGADRIALGSQ